MVVQILTAFIMQVIFTIGLIAVFGFIVSLLNRLFYANFGYSARAVCYATGFIGTPVHELSHALFCLIFGHKIEEIKLFQISDDGTLGYVNHTYNPRNVYHVIGNFFIGVAPIVCISAILYLLSGYLLPDFAIEVENFALGLDIDNLGEALSDIFGIVGTFFSFVASWQFWVFLLVGLFLAPHMTLSGADIKGALGGTGILLLVLLVADAILWFVSYDMLTDFTAIMTAVGGYLLCFFIMALLILAIMVLVSFVIRKIFRL